MSRASSRRPKCPAITISAQMDGYGRKLTNFLKPTLKLMVEFDTVPGDQMEHIKQLIVKDEHTMVVHRSISGRGFHIFCKYSPSDNEDVAILDLFYLMLEKAHSYYEHLLGLECDKACADITRCAGLAYDLEAFFKNSPLNWTFWLTRDDIELMRLHNRLFMVANYAEEQILKYYKVPLPDTPLEYIKFRYTSEILEKIGVNPALRQNLNSHNIGAVMSRLGFKKIHKEHGNGWAVIEKEGCEINSDAVIDPNDTMED